MPPPLANAPAAPENLELSERRAGAPRRSRPRYAPDAQVKRALRIAREEGLSLGGFTMDATGGVTVLDSSKASAPAKVGKEATADEALAAWEASHVNSGNP